MLRENYLLTVYVIVQTLQAASAADIQSYAAVKFQLGLQTNSAVVVASPGFLFNAGVNFPASSSSPRASIVPPVGKARDLTSRAPGQLYLLHEFASRQELDFTYPNGTYTFAIETPNDGSRTGIVQIVQDAYPNFPLVVNFNKAQDIDPAARFTLQWEAMKNSTATDSVQVHFFNERDEPLFSLSGNGQTTAIEIPAGTLHPAREYRALLIFLRVTFLETTTYPGVSGIGGYGSQTSVGLRTKGIRLAGDARTEGFRVRFWSKPGSLYVLQASTNLVHWNTISQTNSPGGFLEMIDLKAGEFPHRFYRATE